MGHALVLLGCRHKLPPELEHEITHIDYRLPGRPPLGGVLDGILASAKLQAPAPAVREAALRAALGMTTLEAENAFALSVVAHRCHRPGGHRPRKGPHLEEERAGGSRGSQPGTGRHRRAGRPEGLAALARQRLRRGGPRLRPALPKGLLIVGIPGTGKSLTAKATASAFGLPLLRLDMGQVFGGIVGQSEANLRAVIQTAEAIAPCVLWIDEIEKGFSGSQGGGNLTAARPPASSAASSPGCRRRAQPVFVVATANDVSQLPAGVPAQGPLRRDVLRGPARRRASAPPSGTSSSPRTGRKPGDHDTAALARACEQFTGAEIEAVFTDALYRAFAPEPRTGGQRPADRHPQHRAPGADHGHPHRRAAPVGQRPGPARRRAAHNRRWQPGRPAAWRPPATETPKTTNPKGNQKP